MALTSLISFNFSLIKLYNYDDDNDDNDDDDDDNDEDDDSDDNDDNDYPCLTDCLD